MKLTNEWKIDLAAVNSTSSSLCSRSFSMKGYDRAVVVTNFGSPASAAAAVGATAVGLAVQVYAGVASAANTTVAMTALSSATGSIQSTVTEVKAQEAKILFIGTIATGLTIVLDGASYMSQTAADATAKLFAKGTDAEAAGSFATVVGANSTKYVISTASGIVTIRRKASIADDSSFMTITCTAQTTADHVMVVGTIQQNVIEFAAADLTATNSSYTNFMVNVQTGAASNLDYSVVVLRHAANQPARQTYSFKQLTS